ncbi:hypothetical protein [Carnobacterium sp. FSL W8-0810]|uniref:hypothetical protein n=1 Tax=Carnobacterium sp. FSL W8-0810 TaxID=2954705 RepID=UPI0030FCE6D6
MNKEGFLETKGMVVVGITELTKVSNYVMEAISNEDAGIGTVSGESTDAFTGETALGDFKLEFHEGYNYENAEPIKEIVTNSAEYNIELPAGFYTSICNPINIKWS